MTATCESVIKTIVKKSEIWLFLNDSFKAFHQLCRHTASIVYYAHLRP